MQPEQIALRQEGILHKVTVELSTSDMRDETLKTQIDNILGSIAALQDDRQFVIDKSKAQQTEIKDLKNRIASLQGRTRKERAAKERLAEEKRFNQLFTKVSSYFEAHEAEVHKQRNQLVVRLKAIQFRVGKYLIMPNNYALLSKVQRAIRSFDEPNVVIEGHTDSTGPDVINEPLSQQRAEAVREYFVANKTLPSREIIAVGYGSKQPLASNETEEGRAVNRRIDVVIRPLP